MATSTDLRAAIEEVQSQIPAEQVEAGLAGAYEADLLTRINRRVGALPWWAISSAVHAVIFLLATLLTVAMPPAQVDEVMISTDVVKKEEHKYDETKPRDIFRNPQEVVAEEQVENPVVVHEKAEVAEHFETDNNMDMNSARGSEDAISDIPLGGTGVVGSMGVGGGGMAGCFGYRDGGGRRRAVARFGGSKETESAVEAALRWLARHQEQEGNWDTQKLEGKGKYDMAATGLAALAFLGAGYTAKNGKYKDNVRRALNWMIKNQADDGCLGRGYGRMGYSHAIGGLALAEAFGMDRDPYVGKAGQKAVDYSLEHQHPYSGWRYEKKQSPDSSVSGWFVMQMKSAKIAGLKVDGSSFQGAANWYNSVTDGEGRCGYTSKKPGLAMTAVGITARLFMGASHKDPLLQKGGEYMLSRGAPRWSTTNSGYRYYWWYYGTLAAFQLGGDKWDRWNKGLKTTLIPNQRKGGDEDGSWDPHSWDAGGAGRAYSTSMGALCLEVYYRYLPLYTK